MDDVVGVCLVRWLRSPMMSPSYRCVLVLQYGVITASPQPKLNTSVLLVYVGAAALFAFYLLVQPLAFLVCLMWPPSVFALCERSLYNMIDGPLVFYINSTNGVRKLDEKL